MNILDPRLLILLVMGGLLTVFMVWNIQILRLFNLRPSKATYGHLIVFFISLVTNIIMVLILVWLWGVP